MQSRSLVLLSLWVAPFSLLTTTALVVPPMTQRRRTTLVQRSTRHHRSWSRLCASNVSEPPKADQDYDKSSSSKEKASSSDDKGNDKTKLTNDDNIHATSTNETTTNTSEKSSTKNDTAPKEKAPPVVNKKNLYKLLGATGTETRDELKVLYRNMARKHHPDAQKDNSNDSDVDFADIAAAWKILSDPKERKRYDRSLQAEQFSSDVLTWANQFGRQAAPTVKAFEKVAIPFLRRTTATTVAGFTAAANNLNATSEKDLAKTFQAAFAAARRAGQYVDSIELMEKAQELEERAVYEEQQLQDIEAKVLDLGLKRTELALHTPQSGLTSAEALLILGELNQTVGDNLSVWGRALMRYTVSEEIQELQKAEDSFVELQAVDQKAQSEFKATMTKQDRLRNQLQQAMEEEEAARKAYEAAQQRTVQTKIDLDATTHDLYQAEVSAEKSFAEIKRASQVLEKNSERVRKHLVQKEKEALKHQGKPIEDDSEKTISFNDQQKRLEQLNALRREEQALVQARAKMETNLERIRSRATKLKQRAKALERIKAFQRSDKGDDNSPSPDEIEDDDQEEKDTSGRGFGKSPASKSKP